MTKIKDLPIIDDDDDFTEEERASLALKEFYDIWETSAYALLEQMQRDVAEKLEELPPEAANILRGMLRYCDLDVLIDHDKYYYLVEASAESGLDTAFPLWRKWHPRG